LHSFAQQRHFFPRFIQSHRISCCQRHSFTPSFLPFSHAAFDIFHIPFSLTHWLLIIDC
jgi:hypothetical protein